MNFKSVIVLVSIFVFGTLTDATPIMQFTQSDIGSNFRYDFTFINDALEPVDEFYIEFNLADPAVDLLSVESPAGWDYFDGEGSDLNPNNNYWVGWTAWFGDEVPTNTSQNNFSIITSSYVKGFDYSWNWDRVNHGVAVPEPSMLPMLFGGFFICLSLRRRFHKG